MESVIRLLVVVWLGSALLTLSIVGCGRSSEPTGSGDALIGLITKTEENPFFVKMKEGALERTEKLGVELRAYVGEYDGDWGSQARGILITPPAALSGVVSSAREAGRS